MSVEGLQGAAASQTPGAASETTPASTQQAAAPDPLSPKFAALARKEKELWHLRKQIESEKKALSAREEEYKTSYIPKSKITENPLEVLKQSGLTQDQIIQLILNGPPQVDPTIQTIQEKLAAMEARQLESSKAMEQNQQKAYDQAISQIRTDAETLIASNPDYEMIKETGTTEVVVELIRQTFETEGKLLTVEDAAKEVEEHLLSEGVKMAGRKKVMAKLAPPPAAEEPATNPFTQVAAKKPQIIEKNGSQQQHIKTLTNRETVSVAKPLSAKDRRERAILAARGMLNNT